MEPTAATSSKTGTLYLAFGSNLSSSQMRGRLSFNPSSSIPVGIARLDGWRWIICQRGYANIFELAPEVESSADETVWGVLYNLDAYDEKVLDAYEGHNERRNPIPEMNPDPQTKQRKPYLQGNWDYNKQYLPVTVTKWLVDPKKVLGVDAGSNAVVSTLVYVDEKRTEEGVINGLYIGRMNRAIDEGVTLGMPKVWCETVMRKWVTPNVYPPDHYFGTEDGYIEDGDDA